MFLTLIWLLQTTILVMFIKTLIPANYADLHITQHWERGRVDRERTKMSERLGY